jgi:hypothetical protein
LTDRRTVKAAISPKDVVLYDCVRRPAVNTTPPGSSTQGCPFRSNIFPAIGRISISGVEQEEQTDIADARFLAKR